MIASPMSRRAVVGGAVGIVALNGCSLSTSRAPESDTADRDRLIKARDLSQQLLADILATTAQHPHLAAGLASAQALHTAQVAQFAKSARTSSSPTVASRALLTMNMLRSRETALAGAIRALAFQADRGDVAALLASAAAGIDQMLTGPKR